MFSIIWTWIVEITNVTITTNITKNYHRRSNYHKCCKTKTLPQLSQPKFPQMLQNMVTILSQLLENGDNVVNFIAIIVQQIFEVVGFVSQKFDVLSKTSILIFIISLQKSALFWQLRPILLCYFYYAHGIFSHQNPTSFESLRKLQNYPCSPFAEPDCCTTIIIAKTMCELLSMLWSSTI